MVAAWHGSEMHNHRMAAVKRTGLLRGGQPFEVEFPLHVERFPPRRDAGDVIGVTSEGRGGGRLDLVAEFISALADHAHRRAVMRSVARDHWRERSFDRFAAFHM